MQLWWNASVISFLEKENSGHGGKAKGTVDSAESSGGTGLVTISLLGALVALTSGVDKLTLTPVATLDELLLLEGLVGSAGLGDVVSGLEVEGTGNAVELGGGNAGRC
jgi:hypothetical protein